MQRGILLLLLLAAPPASGCEISRLDESMVDCFRTYDPFAVRRVHDAAEETRHRVNDRGPYAKKFTLDLSQAAAKALGVDKARDRYVEVRIIGLPGEKPLPESGGDGETDRRSLAGSRLD